AASTDIHTLSLHDALPILAMALKFGMTRPKEKNTVATRTAKITSGGSQGASTMSSTELAQNATIAVCDTRRIPCRSTSCAFVKRSEEHTSELQSRENLVCR